MVLVFDKPSNNISILQTKFSDRERHKARRIGLEAVPLDEHIESGHSERQARLKVGPAPIHHLLHMALRHEVARLIVWHVVTRPVVGAADKAARPMRCKSSVVNCLVRTTSIFGTCEGNNTGGARMEKPRLLYGICRSGRGDLGGEQTRRPERRRNGNDLEIWSAVQSLSGGMR